eukprot:TRINITY_DN20726_c0_g3_i1.p1 TRINITY_DN20726_c0_g3~~TRINITY_DN20726_c0_g3_i1.p1  ORF type:complete len:115 (-),score=7.90 TRINITY_DN20726_c0_g3_i1:154-453(-)
MDKFLKHATWAIPKVCHVGHSKTKAKQTTTAQQGQQTRTAQQAHYTPTQLVRVVFTRRQASPWSEAHHQKQNNHHHTKGLGLGTKADACRSRAHTVSFD